MVSHWHMWLSHESDKGVLYEEGEMDTDTLDSVIAFMETSLVKYKTELKRRKRLNV